MTEKQIIKEIENYLKEEDAENLETILKNFVSFDDDWQLKDAIYQAFDIALIEVSERSDCYIMATYYFNDLGHDVVLDWGYWIGQNIDDFSKALLRLINKIEVLKKKLSTIKKGSKNV